MAAPEVILRLGARSPSPAPKGVVAALARVEVRRTDRAPSGFQLVFDSDRDPRGAGLDVITAHLADPFTRVVVAVDLQGLGGVSGEVVLIDGFVTVTELVADKDRQGGQLIVTGEDASVKMDLVAWSTEYPSMNDVAIVNQVLERYGQWVEPQVVSPTSDPTPTTYVPQQNGTDLQQLRKLAARHGHVFYLTPSEDGATAYWGPPVGGAPTAPTLTVGAGADSNATRVRFRHDALAAKAAYGAILDVTVQPPAKKTFGVGSPTHDLKFAKTSAYRGGSSLARHPARFSEDLANLHLRGALVGGVLDHVRATEAAGAAVNLSQDGVVTAVGEVDTFAYGGLLLAPGVVEVRGAGDLFDGKYYIAETTHVIEFTNVGGEYRQSFKLSRAGTGATISRTEP